jgi:hypothetical protein
MRGRRERNGYLISYMSIEARILINNPLWRIRKLVDQDHDRLNPVLRFMTQKAGHRCRRSCLALLLQTFFGIRSERLLLEQLDYNLLCHWFVGQSPDDPIWPPPHLPRTGSGSSVTTPWTASWRS